VGHLNFVHWDIGGPTRYRAVVLTSLPHWLKPDQRPTSPNSFSVQAVDLHFPGLNTPHHLSQVRIRFLWPQQIHE
jgi:hypothetical protein